nr:ribonuclease H-like domain-containing protein [Tanacetum cinerariifolium]
MVGDDNNGDYPETSNTSPLAMKIEHYLSHTDYPIRQVIQNGNGLVFVTIDTNGMTKVLPPKIAEEVVVRERERKARTTLLMALPEDHLAKFHKMAYAKEMFQNILRQLEIHGAGVSHKDANQKFLRSIPSSWSQVALIMRTKPGLDTLSFDDVYNYLRVFERDVKGTTASSSNIQNVAFVFTENTSSTNDVSTAYSVSSPFVSKSQKEGSSSYTDQFIHSFFANQSSASQLDYDDLEQINDDDLDTKDPVSFDKIKVECFNFQKIRHFARDCRATGNQDSRRRDAGNNGNKTRDNGRRPAYQDDSKSLVTIDREDIDWSGHVEEDAQNYAIMGYSSSKSGNYMPSGPDVEIDYSNFTYGPKQTSTDESESKPSEYASCESDSSVETSTSMPETKENASKVVCKPKVWTDAPIIEEYESDSDNDSMSNVQEDKEKPSFAFTDFVKHV